MGRLLGTSAYLLFLMVGFGYSAPKRCDWHGPTSKGEATYKKCIDYAALQGTTVGLPTNVTRISADGISFCDGAFSKPGAGNADIVFIYDNSGSMQAQTAFVDVPNKDTLFYYSMNNKPCSNGGIKGNLTYMTQTGSKTIPSLNNNSGCAQQVSGDPYYARGEVIKEAIDFLVTNSPTSTAGAVSFNETTSHEQTPLPINVTANVNAIKSTVILDLSGGTFYEPPLKLAKEWLNNPSIIKTKRQAIIFISDGAPKDTVGNEKGATPYTTLLDPQMPPIYSIYLGDATTPDTAKLRELSVATGGTFNRVNPRNVAAIKQLMTSILKNITTTATPKSVVVQNSSLTPPQISHSTGVVQNPDGSQGMLLDSIVGLNIGTNNIKISVTKDDNSIIDYQFALNVAGGDPGITGGNLTCYDMPTLTALDKTGNPPIIYPQDGTELTLKLTRSPSDLKVVAIGAESADKDKESLPLGAPDNSLGFISQTGSFKYNPKDPSPTLGNKILEVSDAGDLSFTWSHPRDARETISYTLPGKVPILLDGNVLVKIKDPVTKGVNITPMKLSNPVIIVDNKDKCVVNCTGTDVFWTNPSVPTWFLTVKSPIKYTVVIYDNLGQYVSKGEGSIDSTTWKSLAKNGDSTVVQLKLPPLSENGQPFGTGAYVMRAEITALGNKVTSNAAGDPVNVKSSKREYFRKFGYVRN